MGKKHRRVSRTALGPKIKGRLMRVVSSAPNDGLEHTTTGEQEDARRWWGKTIFCGKCGVEIDGPLFLAHRCQPRLTKK